MSDPILTIIDSKDAPARKVWVQNFNQYRSNNSFKDAAQLIWDDWNTQGNVFFELFPTPEALIFSLVTYVPQRVDLPLVSAAPTPIKWNDTPSYDTFYNLYHSIYVWNCADWQAWHEALEAYYQSTTTANGIWKSAWLHEDNYCFALGQFICPVTSNCRYDCDFVEYFASKGMEIGNLFSNTVCDLSNIILNLTESAQNVSQGVKDTTKTVSKLLPFAAVAVIGYGGTKLYKAL